MSAAGTWKLKVMNTPFGTLKPTLTLRVAGSVLTGQMILNGHTVEIYDGKLTGAHVSWKVDINGLVLFGGTINGRAMSGKVRADPYGPYDFTGKQTAGSRRLTRFLGLARSKDASPPSSPT